MSGEKEEKELGEWSWEGDKEEDTDSHGKREED